MPRKSTTLYPFDNSGPDAVEAQFASQVGSNPLAPAWLIAAQLNREGLRQSNNERATQYMQDTAEATTQSEAAKNKFELIKQMLSRDPTASEGMRLAGADPTETMAWLQSAIGKQDADAFGQLASGAHQAAEAGTPAAPSLLNAAIPGMGDVFGTGTPLSVQTTKMTADASRYAADAGVRAAQARGPSGEHGLKITDTSLDPTGTHNIVVSGPPEQVNTYLGRSVPATGTAGITIPMTSRQQLQGIKTAEAMVTDAGFPIVPDKTIVETAPDGKQYYTVTIQGGGKKHIAVENVNGSQ